MSRRCLLAKPPPPIPVPAPSSATLATAPFLLAVCVSVIHSLIKECPQSVPSGPTQAGCQFRLMLFLGKVQCSGKFREGLNGEHLGTTCVLPVALLAKKKVINKPNLQRCPPELPPTWEKGKAVPRRAQGMACTNLSFLCPHPHSGASL